MTHKARLQMVERLANYFTDKTSIDDIIQNYYEGEFDYWNEVSDEDLLEAYNKNILYND